MHIFHFRSIGPMTSGQQAGRLNMVGPAGRSAACESRRPRVFRRGHRLNDAGATSGHEEPVRAMAGIGMGLKCPECAAEDRADSE